MPKNLITGKKNTPISKQFSKFANPTFITKHNNILSGTGFGKEAYYDTESTIPNFYTPELTPDTWLLPRSRAEILRWCRLFFNLDPYINSILIMHAQYPVCNFRLKYKDKETEAFFNRKLFDNKEFSWIDFLEQVMLSYWKLGEAVVWGDFNEAKGTWNSFSLIDPSLIEYKEDPMSGEVEMSIIPTRELKQMLAEGLKQGRSDIPVEYIRCVQENQKIPLDATGTEANYLTGKKYSPAKVFMLARKTDPGATRGTPIIQSLFKCVTGDTRVALVDGTNPTIKELADSGRKDFWVYGADKQGNIVVAKAECAAYIKDEETLEVTFDNGAKVRCTKDHPFFLRDMTKVEAQNLKPGDSLMPLYRKDVQMGRYSKNKSSYEKVYNPADETWKLTHVISALQENKEQFKLTGSRVIHHKDFNSKNNTPENLVVLSREEHARIHGREQDPEFISRITKLAAEKRMSDDSFSNKMKEHWADPEYKQQVINSRKNFFAKSTDDYKKQRTINIKAGLAEHWTPRKKKLAEFIKEKSTEFFGINGRKPSFTELAPICGVSIGTLTNYGRQFGYDYLGINSKDFAGYKNHTVVSVVSTGKVEPVYCVANAGENHNFMIAFEDGSGILSGNTLIYSDKIRLAQIAIADRLHLPMEIWSIGEYTGDPNTSIIPDDGMIANVREAIREATMQPPFSIFVPPYIKYEAVGVNGKLLSVYEDLGYVENCIFVALGVNKNLILGQGPSFSSSKQTSLFKLIKMYKMMRLKLEAFIKRYIILPIAKANDVKDEYGDYVVPDIDWEESLNPEQDVEKFNNILKLWDKGLVSTTTLYEYFPGKLDINLEKQRLEEEKLTIFDKGTDRLGSKAQRSDLKNNDANKGKTPKPSDGSKPAENLPPPLEGGVKDEGEGPAGPDAPGGEDKAPEGGEGPEAPAGNEGPEGE